MCCLLTPVRPSHKPLPAWCRVGGIPLLCHKSVNGWSTGCCSGAPESGHLGSPPLPGHGSTHLLCVFNPVPAAIAAVVVHVVAVSIGWYHGEASLVMVGTCFPGRVQSCLSVILALLNKKKQ